MDKKKEVKLKALTSRQLEAAGRFSLYEPRTAKEAFHDEAFGKTVVYKHLESLRAAGAIVEFARVASGGRPKTAYVLNPEAVPVMIQQLETRAERITNVLGVLREGEALLPILEATAATLRSELDS